MITRPFATNYTMLHSRPDNLDNLFIKLFARTLECVQIYPAQFILQKASYLLIAESNRFKALVFLLFS